MLVALFIMLGIIIVTLGPIIWRATFGDPSDKAITRARRRAESRDWRANVDMTLPQAKNKNPQHPNDDSKSQRKEDHNE